MLDPGYDIAWLEISCTSFPDGATGNTALEGSNRGFADDSICGMAHIGSHGTSVENNFVAQGQASSEDRDAVAG